MEFQSTVILIAAILLIISLTYIGYLIRNLIENRKYPPTISRCPDFFVLTREVDENGNIEEYCRNVKNIGKPGATRYPLSGSTYTEKELLNMNEATRQDIKNFLLNNNLTWDGVQM